MAESIIDWAIDNIFPWVFIILLVGIFIIIPCVYFFTPKSETFSLVKDEWSCTKEYEYTSTIMVMVGKVMVPQIITHHDCIQWNKK